MIFRNFFFCIEQGCKNIFKHRLMSFASITTIACSILMIIAFYATFINLDFMIGEFEKNIGIAVFFEKEATENDILAIKMALDARKEVYSTTYITADEAWESFKEEYFNGREELIKGFGDDNPLKDSASIQVLLSDVSMQKDLVEELSRNRMVRHIRQTEKITDIIESFKSLIAYVGVIILVALIFISLFLISNTIRLAVALRKDEINVMRYIGAKTSLIRGPFTVEGIIIGFLGGAFPLVIFYFFYSTIVSKLQMQFLVLSDFLVFLSTEKIMGSIIPISLLSGIIIGYLGSRVTVGKYIKV